MESDARVRKCLNTKMVKKRQLDLQKIRVAMRNGTGAVNVYLFGTKLSNDVVSAIIDYGLQRAI